MLLHWKEWLQLVAALGGKQELIFFFHQKLIKGVLCLKQVAHAMEKLTEFKQFSVIFEYLGLVQLYFLYQ